MITAVHSLVYADDAPAARDFFRDVLGWPSVDTGGGWLIFRTGPSELAAHPTSGEGWSTPQHHEISLMCDNLEATMAELADRGATFSGGVQDQGWGLVTTLEVPGAGGMLLYEPKHPTAHGL